MSTKGNTNHCPKCGNFCDENGNHSGECKEKTTQEIEKALQQELPKEKVEVVKVESDNNQLKECTPHEIKSNLLSAKMTNREEDRWRVDDTYTEENYKHCKTFSTSGGSVVAVKGNGDIVSVCKNQNEKGLRGKELLQQAIKQGGNKLDAFGGKLYNFYTKNGFEPVSWTPFNKKHAPHDWKEEYGEEPVIFYKYTGNKTNLAYNEFLSSVKPCLDSEKENGYDLAYKLRDMEIEE